MIFIHQFQLLFQPHHIVFQGLSIIKLHRLYRTCFNPFLGKNCFTLLEQKLNFVLKRCCKEKTYSLFYC